MHPRRVPQRRRREKQGREELSVVLQKHHLDYLLLFGSPERGKSEKYEGYDKVKREIVREREREKERERERDHRRKNEIEREK